MKKIIPIAAFFAFMNLMMWIEREPSEGLSLNRILVGISSILMLIMLIVAKKINDAAKKKFWKSSKKMNI